ncbi:hypothetical protein FOVG_03024 [Fusarium oxysporum f. sp. pisi HDV247]|uniref:Uncharacterized protein n=1 Tax=Fusarium oxysporum f. sp. pisi HDV247 TaxID=1080344 RepID=W9Q6J9_FUSOX|nr:hypothetical protein FOVG_03024 [Fusarium oxysporum f. sp. pisi HDV247]
MRRYHHVYTCYRVSRRGGGGGEQRFAPACPFVALSDLPQILQQVLPKLRRWKPEV